MRNLLRLPERLAFLDLRLAPVRAEPGLREAVLVALTGRGSEDDKQKSNEAGFDFHLTKPTEVAAVEGLLARMEAEDDR